ncbi:hypothetical protein KNN17_10850 [Arthrobacter bambusae]|uniref:hypothetical protein n=1 Tax=Arthrobacter bambusae TaxID=1338426 RepID=UPI001F508EF9|nr:hypothetical protein [Arthrobacter bambusae]MCI0142077.1 hypothetical protein [Arthrobacter bambusae]
MVITLGAIGTIYYALRIIGFVDGDIDSALALIPHLDLLPTLTAMVVSVVPFMAIPFALLLVLVLRRMVADEVTKWVIPLVGVIFVVAALALSNVAIAALATLLWGARSLYKGIHRHRLVPRRMARLLQAFVPTGGIVMTWTGVILLFTTAIGLPWQSSESIAFHGEPARTFFVISQDDNHLTVVDDAARNVTIRNATAIDTRESCIFEESRVPLSRSVYQLLIGWQPRRACPN